MAKAKFTPSRRGIGKLLNSPQMLEATIYFADKVLRRAEATAPVYEQGPHPGRYKRAFTIEAQLNGGLKHNRAQAKVVNTSPEAFLVEYGSKNNDRHRTLGSAGDAARE